jgi:hypothetical protein
LPDEILHVKTRRAARAKRVQTAQHVFAAGILIMNGTDHLHHNAPLAIAEIVAGALLVAAVLLEKRLHHRVGKIGWIELAGAAMTTVEAIEKTRGKHHAMFYVLAFVQPLILLLFAIFDAQLSASRYLKVDDDGLVVRLRLIFWRRIPWSAIKGFRFRDDALDLGGRSISLKQIINRDEARDWLLAQFKQRGVEELPA